MIDNCLIAFVRGFNIANTAPVVHVRQNPARKPIETAQPRSMVALIEASNLLNKAHDWLLSGRPL
jgi:hypothetical protein